MATSLAPRVSFKAQMLKVREDAIILAAGRLLAEKGYDAMTVDQVAAKVGIAKASLYKHFSSKDHLAAAAIVRVMHRAQEFLGSLSVTSSPLENLRAVVRWTLTVKLAGDMPSLPGQNSSLRATLLANIEFMDALRDLNDRLGAWIEAAQSDGAISRKLPAEAVLYTLYARACDPALEFFQSGGRHSDEAIIELVLGTCFDGLSALA